MKTTDNEKWFMYTRQDGVIECLPLTFDRSQLIDVTRISDKFAKFISSGSQGIIDCEDFYKVATNENN